MTGFRDTTVSPPTFIQGTPVTINVEVDIQNQAVVGNNILAVTGGGVNYVLQLEFTNVDIKTSINTLMESSAPVTFSSSVQQGLASSASITLVGTASVTLSATDCPNVQYLCVRLSAGMGASYIDINNNDNSNAYCIDVTSRMQCQTGFFPIFTCIYRVNRQTEQNRYLR